MKDKLYKAAEYAVSLLKQKNLKISVAESCTGGMLSSLITSVSGASSVYELGVTSYSRRIKNKLLLVDCETLREYGAVSSQTAEQMSEGILALSGADIALAVTGNAGPDPSENKPVGLVYISLSDRNKTIVKQLNIEPLGREYVREAACLELLQTLSEYLTQA